MLPPLLSAVLGMRADGWRRSTLSSNIQFWSGTKNSLNNSAHYFVTLSLFWLLTHLAKTDRIKVKVRLPHPHHHGRGRWSWKWQKEKQGHWQAGKIIMGTSNKACKTWNPFLEESPPVNGDGQEIHHACIARHVINRQPDVAELPTGEKNLKSTFKIMKKTPEGPFLVFCDEGHCEEGDWIGADDEVCYCQAAKCQHLLVSSNNDEAW